MAGLTMAEMPSKDGQRALDAHESTESDALTSVSGIISVPFVATGTLVPSLESKPATTTLSLNHEASLSPASLRPHPSGSTPALNFALSDIETQLAGLDDFGKEGHVPKLPQDDYNPPTEAPTIDPHFGETQLHTLWTKPSPKPLPKYHPAMETASSADHHTPTKAHHTHHISNTSSAQLVSQLDFDAGSAAAPPITRSETPRKLFEEQKAREIDAVSTAGEPLTFTPKSSPLRSHFAPDNVEFHPSPDVSDAHRQPPKETHFAEIDVDPISGRKIINDYEFIEELGRGQHGKVKLCRSLTTGQSVAIKIIERVSKRRRLGRSSNQEAKIKREIAILKKARHQNIVSLLEIIDDPNSRKVYIVLEHVLNGEIKWRIKGEPEICLVDYRRYRREIDGTLNNEAELLEDTRILEAAIQKRQQKKDDETRRLAELQFRLGPWSLEHGGDSDLESEKEISAVVGTAEETIDQRDFAEPSIIDVKRRYLAAEISTPNRHSGTFQTDEYKTALEASAIGAFTNFATDPDAMRRPSYYSDMTDDESDVPENFSWVPRLTLEEARRALRDTVLGLEFLHYQGIIHRDIKPANLLLTHDYRIKISDFGVSYLGKAVSEQLGEDQSESEAQDQDEAIELAKTVGTPAFYAPELCVTDFDELDPPNVTGQIDVWALGVTLYCLIYGRTPFYDQNTFVLMRNIAEEKVHIPRHRLRAIEVDNTGKVLFDPTLQASPSQNLEHRRRLGDQLIYEYVDDDLQDLLKGLLHKDPRQRLKLSQVKKHKWLLAGMHDPTAWAKESDPSLMSKGKKIEVSKEDVESAVHMKIVDNIRSVGRKIAGTIGGLVKSNSSRKRAKSSATIPGSQPPSAASSSSNMSQDALRMEMRRPSLRPDELVGSALRASRDSDHPLSQSVTASPEIKEERQFFASSLPESPATGPTSSPWHSRPDALERGASATGSIRTIRPTEYMLDGYIPLTAPWTMSQNYPEHTVSPVHLVGAMLRRTPLHDFDESRQANTEVPTPREEIIHAEPTLGINSITASGLLNRPAVLQDHVSAGSAAHSPLSFQPESTASSSEFFRIRGSDTMSRVSSNHSLSSTASRALPTIETYGGTSKASFLRLSDNNSHGLSSTTKDSEEVKLRRAKDEQIRRLIKEGQENQLGNFEMQPDPDLDMECPPSPDDLAFSTSVRSADTAIQHGASYPLPGPHSAYSVFGIQPTYSDDRFASEISQSTSNRSLPSAVSASSSVGLQLSEIAHPRDGKYHGIETPVGHAGAPDMGFEHQDVDMYGYEQLDDEDSGDESDGSFVEMSITRKSKPSQPIPSTQASSSNAS